MGKVWGANYKTYDTSKGFGNAKKWQGAFEERMNLKTLTNEDIEQHKGILQPMYDAKGQSELKKAYYSLMNEYHPDKAGDTDENKTIAQMINEAYINLQTIIKTFTK